MEAKHKMQTNTGWILCRTQSIAPETSTGKANQATTRYVGSIDLDLSDNDDVDRVAADRLTIFEDRHRDSGPTFCSAFLRMMVMNLVALIGRCAMSLPS
jgi:hypothetical protein